MSKKNKNQDRKRSEAEAANEARKRQARELRNAIGISTVIFLTIWTIIILAVLSEGLWGP
jgi:hypothetical protein